MANNNNNNNNNNANANANDDDFFSTTTIHTQVSGPHVQQPNGAHDFAAAIANRFGSTSMLTAKLPAPAPAPALPPTSQPDAADDFAAAIANRFGSANMITAKLPPALPQQPQPSSTIGGLNIRLPSSPMSKLQIAPAGPLDITTVRPADLDGWLYDESARTLVVDIRPHAAYANARLPKAVSLSVPSTLLKRPLFSLERLCEMLPSSSARARFSAWKSASRILVYDADSTHIPETSNIYGLLRKFKNDSFHGELAWLQGGFQAVWKERRLVVDEKPPQGMGDPEEEEETSSDDRVLRTKRLPMAAFTLSSTTQSRPKRQGGLLGSSRAPQGMTLSELNTPSITRDHASSSANPFFDNIRQNAELSHGITERIPLRLPRRVRRRINDLPFTWLQEIARRAAALPRTVPHPTPRRGPHDYSSTSESEDDNADEPDPTEVEEGMEALAMQFYRIEVAEQRRLMNIMEHHTRESNTPQPPRDRPLLEGSEGGSSPKEIFPYSIIAGVEKGSKNRYRNIWPFEHARVRLRGRKRASKVHSMHSPGPVSEHDSSPPQGPLSQETPRPAQSFLPSPEPESDDYVNASHVQPLGTNKRYIATQGPLPDTFVDFWTLVWQQNVHVIVMLTREIEGSMIKCGSYWTENAYGPLRLKLVSSSGGTGVESDSIVKANQNQAQGFFGFQAPPQHGLRPRQIKRVFELRHTKFPRAGARKVVQIQYLEWPDMNVPDDPRGVLDLIKEVDQCAAQAKVEARQLDAAASSDNEAQSPGSDDSTDSRTGLCKLTKGISMNPPILLHCSAGVGRTGGFIAVDAVLDGMRREMRKRREYAVANPGASLPTPTTPANDGDGDVTMADHDPEDTKGAIQDSHSIACHVGESSSSGSRKEKEADQDVDMKNGEQAGATRAGPHFVHVPVATYEQREGAKYGVDEWDGGKEPSPDVMQVDGQEYQNKKGREGTRKWVEDVTAQTGVGATGGADVRKAPASGAFSASPSPRGSASNSLSTGSSLSDDSSFGFKTSARRRSESLLGTSSPATSGSNANGSTKDVAMREVGEDMQRMRTTSVPSTLRPKVSPQSNMQLGSSPLAAASTPSFGSPAGFFAVPHLPASAGPSGLSRAMSPGSVFTDASNAPTGPSNSRSNSGSGSIMSPPGSTDNSHPSAHTSPDISPSDAPRADAMDQAMSSAPGLPSMKVTMAEGTTPGLRGKGKRSREPASYVDYKEPRKLHGDASPPLLSSFDDPICEVVQDMREQRMSLCQSLRQYVFVHAAVIEGALMIADEEREEAKRRGAAAVSQRPIRSLPGSALGHRGSSEELLRRPTSSAMSSTQRPPSTNTQTPRPTLRQMDHSDTSSSATASTGTGKRGASPTELRKEDKRGEVRLSKRPSLKRKAPTLAAEDMLLEHPHPRPLHRPPSTGTRLAQVPQGVPSSPSRSSGAHPPP